MLYNYKKYIKENIDQKTENLYLDILCGLGYYDFKYYEGDKYKYNKYNCGELLPIAKDIYNKNKNIFSNTIVRNEFDNSLELVYHSTFDNFNIFKTPSFFGGSSGYAGDETITYNCILDIKNPIELRSTEYSNKKDWYNLLEDIFKNEKDKDNILDFAHTYSDGYGFFKLLQDPDWTKPYKWDIIYKYIADHGYDGAVYKESDRSISSFFTGYLVMKPEQIKILFKFDDDKKEIID